VNSTVRAFSKLIQNQQMCVSQEEDEMCNAKVENKEIKHSRKGTKNTGSRSYSVYK
jgi:hypothetical protein